MNNSPYKDLPVLILMTFVLFVLKAIWAVLISTGPTIIDELRYGLNASAIFTLQKYFIAKYPPAYPLVLAPALFFKHWYEAMLVINAFWSSLVLPATWFLARTAGVRNPLLVAVLAGLLPLHFVFPSILFSENLFVPLFVLVVALALRGGKRGHIEALVFGLVLGIAHLTKYLFLPALPLLFGAWLYFRSKSNQKVQSGNLLKRYYLALLVLLAYSLVIGIWLCYGRASGFGWGQLFGFGLTPLFGYSISGIKTKAANIESFLMYSVAYTSYIVLAWLLVWEIIAIWISQLSYKGWRIELEPPQQRFHIFVLLLLGCYWLVAVQHSFGAGYNYPVPQRITGRYLMHLAPIMLIVGVWLLERFSESPAPLRKIRALIGAGVVAGLAALSWWILFNKGIWGFNDWFANREPGTVDVIALVSLPMFLLAIVMVLLLVAVVCVRRNNIRLLLLPVVVLMMVSLVVDARRMYALQDGLHFRELAASITVLNQQDGRLQVLYENNVLNRPFFKERMLFWGVNKNQLPASVVSSEKGINFSSLLLPTLFLTSTHVKGIETLREYMVNKKKYYIYRIDNVDRKALPSELFSLGKDKR